ncbi:hypothetical protein HCN44_005756 [Aphidius gifuensis]|uniref:Uncharacterized protein n=1 Tax=Aphidius gifuensis TaxID=684658 RepID=A0A835CU51_APHGI|nr:uncharacterized protein LOC122852826 [Aphidius gifuensis]KAF7992975.1 hypothetical protein HCN44_005756 [Aphidius gifuensis]
MANENKQEYHRASNAVVYGGLIMFIGGIFLWISFMSPYWLESYDGTFREFKSMGIWQYCFEDFRYPYYQFDKLFNGCHAIYSTEYHVIREWLLPAWLLIIQIFCTLAFLLSFFAQGVIALTLVRIPLRLVLRYEWMMSSVASVCSATSAALLFFSVLIFPTQCWRRDWLMYPKMNHLSWSWYFAIVALILHAVAALMLYLDACQGYKMRKESRNLVVQMQPNPRSNQSSLHRMGYI